MTIFAAVTLVVLINGLSEPQIDGPIKAFRIVRAILWISLAWTFWRIGRRTWRLWGSRV